ASRHQPVEQALALDLGEQLGVAHLVDPLVARQHGRADGQRPGPGPTTDLVDADNHLVTVGPQLLLGAAGGGAELGHHWPPNVPRAAYARRTAGSPASTNPTAVNRASTARRTAASATAASRPPEVCGSKQSASSASVTAAAVATRPAKCSRLRGSPPVRT